MISNNILILSNNILIIIFYESDAVNPFS